MVSTERRALPALDPLTAYLALAERFGDDEIYLLESPSGPATDRRHAVVGFGVLLTISVTGTDVRITGEPDVVAAVRARVSLPLTDRRGVWDLLRDAQSAFPRTPGFGFLSFFGYDTAHYVEDLPRTIPGEPGAPDVCVVLHRGRIRFDVASGEAELLLHHSELWPDLEPDAVLDALRVAPEPADARVPPAVCVDETDEPTFRRNVRRALGHIAIGDIYQVQIGHELRITSELAPVDVYRRLRERNPSPYMYLARLAGDTVIGASPELFVRFEDGVATMRPIAGTIPLDAGPQAAARLRADPKEIAEHVMLVDLCRNDIGRVCDRDTLDVPDMLAVDRYSHVAHLVSTVVGRVSEVDSYEVVRALFPSGTMTGAPKIRAMEIIESIESSRRGLYAGALGLIDFDGALNLALCIRSLTHAGNTYRTRASAGVVADSDPGAEWRETLAKMSAAYWAVTGKELVS
ncbi:anthranilate synthase component I family protein [Lentzea tibetensis]|uniref:Anthranilate synthase component I family protein n=1 Tax=Lentzea tibetensis TaxID=2591470 RepID=A0A563F256_9PSEU|nr:anthranilate synthase component I family protein [Lentzea tibetensis]TWP53818.1 anthranilate synthase component I family protein [Lentzea tibetensis]